MTTLYPGALDALTNPNSAGGDQLNSGAVLHDAQHANANDAIEALEATLGINPHGSFATVKARLDALELRARVPKVNSYFGPSQHVAGAAGTVNFGSGAVPMVWFEVGKAISIDQLGARVSTLEAAQNFKALLYASDSDGYPTGSPIANSGSLSTAATGDILGTFSNVALTPGIYWATIRSSGTVARFLACTQLPNGVSVATTTTNIWNAVNYVQADPGTFASPGALASIGDNTTTGSNSVQPVIFVRRSV